MQKSAVRLFDCTLYSGISAAEASERFSKAHIPTAAQFRVQLDIDVDLDEYTIIPKPNIFAKYVTMAGLSRDCTVCYMIQMERAHIEYGGF